MFAEWDGSRHNVHSNAKNIMDSIRGGRSSNEYLAMGNSGLKVEEPTPNGIDTFSVKPNTIAYFDDHPVGSQPDYNILRSGPPINMIPPIAPIPPTAPIINTFVPKKEQYCSDDGNIYFQEQKGFVITKDMIYLFIFVVLFILIMNLYTNLQKTYHIIANMVLHNTKPTN
jgi:hypothetical protein